MQCNTMYCYSVQDNLFYRPKYSANVQLRPIFTRVIIRTCLGFMLYVHYMFVFVFILLFVPGECVCIMLRHLNSCLTFVIMWCVEEYCDMHR